MKEERSTEMELKGEIPVDSVDLAAVVRKTNIFTQEDKQVVSSFFYYDYCTKIK